MLSGVGNQLALDEQIHACPCRLEDVAASETIYVSAAAYFIYCLPLRQVYKRDGKEMQG